MGPAKRKKWRCRKCRYADSNSAQGSDIDDHQDDVVSEALLSVINAKLDQLVSLPAKVDELLTLRPAVHCLQETIKTLQDTINDLSSKYDSVLAKATENEKTAKALQVQLAEVNSVVEEQSQTIQRLQGDLNYLEQQSRSTNLEIHGLPQAKDENLDRTIADLGAKLDLPPLQPADIIAAHRIPAKSDVAPPILIRFATVRAYDAWMSRRARLRPLFQSGELPRVYFNENLTRANRELFWMARTKAKEANFKFVWVTRGKIFAKKAENSALVRVNTVNDLVNIG